ncbi:metalloproteinase, extracellular matrix glycoprotein VMP41, partial [Volvox carteri f. nagariensis]
MSNSEPWKAIFVALRFIWNVSFGRGWDSAPVGVSEGSCHVDELGVCNPASASSTTILSARPVLLPGANSDIIYKQRLLVIIMDYSACRAPAALSEFGARNIFMGKPSPVGLGSGITQKYLQCSYGKLNITAFKAITVTANCSSNEPGPSFSTCPVLRFIKDGSSGAKDILGEDAFLSDFSHYVYVLPPGVNEFCRGDWAAVPGRQIVLRTLLGSLERWSATLELTLHNFGLWHSWQGGHEFEDGSSPSGRKDVCPNAPELAYLGWTSPVKGGGQVDANTLPVGTVRSFNLPATYLTSDGHFVRVVPDWLPTYSNRTGAKNLYIAVRVNKGGDALLAAPYANAVNVHEVNATM